MKYSLQVNTIDENPTLVLLDVRESVMKDMPYEWFDVGCGFGGFHISFNGATDKYEVKHIIKKILNKYGLSDWELCELHIEDQEVKFTEIK